MAAKKRPGKAGGKSKSKSKAPAAPRGSAAKAPPRSAGRVKETAYQKRLRRFAEKHPEIPKDKIRQRARGHHEKEHVERRAREVDRHGMTTWERHKVREFAHAAALRCRAKNEDVDKKAEEIFRVLLERTRERGYPDFKEHIAGFVKRMQKISRDSKSKDEVVIAGRAARRAEMEELAEEWDIDMQWLFYG